jgi:hypothetical protein
MPGRTTDDLRQRDTAKAGLDARINFLRRKSINPRLEVEHVSDHCQFLGVQGIHHVEFFLRRTALCLDEHQFIVSRQRG